MRISTGLALALLAGGLAATLAAQGDVTATDAARSAWQYRRPVVLPAAAGGRFIALAVPPDVAAHSQRALQDLRIVAADGREVPFVIDVDVPRDTERRRDGHLVEAQRERRQMSGWIIDFGVRAPFDRLELDIDRADFSKRAWLETSDEGLQWTPVEGEAWIFDRPWQGRRVHDTAIERPAPIVARFVRVTLDDARSAPVVVRGATAVLAGHLGGRRWTRDAALVRLDTPAGQPSRYRVQTAPGLPVERLTIAADDAAFWRQVRVFEESPGHASELVSAAAPIYRLRLGDGDLDVEDHDIELTRPASGTLTIEIDDGDSPALTRPRVTLSGMERRVLVAPIEGGLTLYYGNPVTRRPVYDLEALRTRLALAVSYPEATLGAEATNPRFAPLPPLAFLAARGAAADTTTWAYARTVRIEGGDDVYTLTLAPADVAHLREDLADLRLVDAAGRQVPYVGELHAAAARVPLRIAPATPRSGATKTSAFELRLVDVPEDAAPPVSEVELTFAEAFFTRPATFTVADARAPQGRRVIGQETLRALRREPGVAAAPQVIAVGDLRLSRLVVEVHDGDNAPLTVAKGDAVVWVPRVTFKATGGTYRLLLGSATAEAPTYDLAALRQDVLAYSAIPVAGSAMQPLAANPDYARRPGDVVEGLARGPLLWGVLAVSIGALLWLTARILKTPPKPPAV